MSRQTGNYLHSSLMDAASNPVRDEEFSTARQHRSLSIQLTQSAATRETGAKDSSIAGSSHPTNNYHVC